MKLEYWCLKDKITNPLVIGRNVSGLWVRIEDINILREKLIEDFDSPKATEIINKRFRGAE